MDQAVEKALETAIWEVLIDGKHKSKEKVMTHRYGHIPFGPTQVFDEFF
jgi:hypothetical protein